MIYKTTITVLATDRQFTQATFKKNGLHIVKHNDDFQRASVTYDLVFETFNIETLNAIKLYAENKEFMIRNLATNEKFTF